MSALQIRLAVALAGVIALVTGAAAPASAGTVDVGRGASAVLNCAGGTSPTLVVRTRAHGSRPVGYRATVDGRTAAQGSVRPVRGTVAVTLALPDRHVSRVLLLVAGRTVMRANIPAACTVRPVAPAPTDAPPAVPATTPPTAPVAAPPATSDAAPAVGATSPVGAAPAGPSDGLAPGSLVPVAAEPTAARGAASSYALHANSDGSVLRWNPCAGPVHVLVNTTAAGPGALTDVLVALGQVEQASGLSFVYDGPTTAVPHRTGDPAAQLVVAWADPGLAAGQSDWFIPGAAGMGGTTSRGTSSDGMSWTWQVTSGFVVLDAGLNDQVPAGFGPGVTRGALLLHELGHAVGLEHSTDQSQAMYPMLSSASAGSYGAGDRTGLALVGTAPGCIRSA